MTLTMSLNGHDIKTELMGKFTWQNKGVKKHLHALTNSSMCLFKLENTNTNSNIQSLTLWVYSNQILMIIRKFRKQWKTQEADYLVKQGRIFPGIKFNVQILQTTAKSFAVLESPPPQVHIFNIQKKLSGTLKFIKNWGVLSCNIRTQKLIFEVIKCNSSPTPLHVKNLNHIFTKWILLPQPLKGSLVMVQNNHPTSQEKTQSYYT